MNIKISKDHHKRLQNRILDTRVVGSWMYGTNNEESDIDIICFYEEKEENFESFLNNSFSKALPSIHPFQYDCEESDTDFIWTTYDQFFRNLVSGDSVLNFECFIWADFCDDPLPFVRTYKIMKAINGFCKRDIRNIRDHESREKYRFHAVRGIYMLEELLENRIPSLAKVRELGYNHEKLQLSNREKDLRAEINRLYDSGELPLYFVPQHEDELVRQKLNANNIKEFRYD